MIFGGAKRSCFLSFEHSQQPSGWRVSTFKKPEADWHAVNREADELIVPKSRDYFGSRLERDRCQRGRSHGGLNRRLGICVLSLIKVRHK
jgi:hypothetical protein